MAIATPLGVLLALGLARWRGRGSAAANSLMLVPLVTPEIVMAVSLLVVFTQLALVPFSLIHLGTTAQVVGQVTFSLSYVVVIIRSRLASIGNQYEEAARDLGASPSQAIRLVLVPLLMPAILASLLIVFALSIDDFVVTQYMSSNAATQTIPMILYGTARGGTSTPALNALATIMIVITLGGITLAYFIYTIGRSAAGRSRERRLGAARAVGNRRRMTTQTEGAPHARRGGTASADQAIRRFPGGRRDRPRRSTPGEFFSLLGPSGCGKTTTLRMIAGFVRPTEGEILLDGVDVAQVPPHKRNVHTVFQNYALFPTWTCSTTSLFGLKRKKVAKDEARRRAQEAIELVELGGFEQRKPSQLSGGQQQRVALARALVLRPAVLLLDEPLGALDAKIRKQLRLELKGLQEEVGITFVFVTHDQEEALSMSDRVAVMSKARSSRSGPRRRSTRTPRPCSSPTSSGSPT